MAFNGDKVAEFRQLPQRRHLRKRGAFALLLLFLILYVLANGGLIATGLGLLAK